MATANEIPTFNTGETANLLLEDLIPARVSDAFADEDVTVTFTILDASRENEVDEGGTAVLEGAKLWRVIHNITLGPGTYYVRCEASVGTATFIHLVKIKVEKG